MRTIKFRGKRLYDGEWVYGNLVVSKDGQCYISEISNFEEMTARQFHTQTIQVDPATVGQFVGTFNGQDLYECDILRVDNGYDIWHTVVQFDQERLAYHRLQDYGIGKIVGNIHDNSEILKTE